jgi:hypothetical protein
VAVNWRLAPVEMEHTINDAEAKALFVGGDFRAPLEEIESKLPTAKKIIVLGDVSQCSGMGARHPGAAGDHADRPDSRRRGFASVATEVGR